MSCDDQKIISPYNNLEKYRFWKSSIAEGNPYCLEDIHKPKWKINETDKFVTMGSCFAQHIGKKLKSLGFSVPYYDDPQNVRNISFSANYGNVYSVRQALQLLKESTGERFSSESEWSHRDGVIDPLRPNVFEKPFANVNQLLSSRNRHLASVKEAIADLDVFVFTLGLTEAWIVNSCETVLPSAPGVLGGNYSKDRYTFKNFSYNEIVSDLRSMISIINKIRKKNPFRMLLTVSPVPLTATAEDRHVLVSSTYSKSVLRAAAGEVSQEYEFVDYFPSFEIITNPRTISGNYNDNQRDVKNSSVDMVMDHFQHAYITSGSFQGINEHSDEIISSDELDDVDCEDALLEQFATQPPLNNILEDPADILFFGNSHLGFFRNSLTNREVLSRSSFVPFNFVSNDPFNDLEQSKFRSFKFREKSFEDRVLPNASILVVVGFRLFGDAIVRSFGELVSGYEGCKGSDISPLIPVELNVENVRGDFKRAITNRINLIVKVNKVAGFKKVFWIVCPDMPHNVALFRLGEEFVNSSTYLTLKEIYHDEFLKVCNQFNSSIEFILHEDDSLYDKSGFVKSMYSGKLPWDIHPNKRFYADSGVTSAIEACLGEL